MGNYRLSDALVRDPANANDDNERLLQLIESNLSTGSGSPTDVANTDSATSGSAISWLKGIVKILASVWNSTVGFLRVGFNADLQTGVNQYVQKTLTLSSTDYTTNIPDNARIVVFNATAAFRYAVNEAVAAINAQVDNSNILAVGSYYGAPGNDSASVLPSGTGRVLHTRSVTAGVVINISFR